jgi:rubredoxin
MTDIDQLENIEGVVSQEVPCRDPECAGLAEPDQDGEHIMYECQSCGYIFGYERLPSPTGVDSSGGTCAIGVPEELRRAASQFAENALATVEGQQGGVSVTLKTKDGRAVT